jgi:hypothetical protein
MNQERAGWEKSRFHLHLCRVLESTAFRGPMLTNSHGWEVKV